jgi:nitroreductase
MTVFFTFNVMAQDNEDKTTNDSTMIEEPALDNPVIQAIMNRRSIRKYLDKPVEHEKLEIIADCAINAPSGSNRQPWQVRIIENQELLAQINEVFMKENAPQIKRDKNFKNLFRNAPNIIIVCTPTKGGGQIDAGMLGQNIMLAAQSLGLGTCCLGGIVRFVSSNPKTEFFRDELNIPADYSINYIIAIGYPDETPDPKPRDPSKVMFIE